MTLSRSRINACPPYVMPYFTALPNLERTKLQSRPGRPCHFAPLAPKSRYTNRLGRGLAITDRARPMLISRKISPRVRLSPSPSIHITTKYRFPGPNGEVKACRVGYTLLMQRRLETIPALPPIAQGHGALPDIGRFDGASQRTEPPSGLGG